MNMENRNMAWVEKTVSRYGG